VPRQQQHLYFSFISNSHFGDNNRAACVIRIINRFEFSFQLSVSSFDCSDNNGKAREQHLRRSINIQRQQQFQLQRSAATALAPCR
jgi:hypothetical protein